MYFPIIFLLDVLGTLRGRFLVFTFYRHFIVESASLSSSIFLCPPFVFLLFGLFLWAEREKRVQRPPTRHSIEKYEKIGSLVGPLLGGWRLNGGYYFLWVFLLYHAVEPLPRDHVFFPLIILYLHGRDRARGRPENIASFHRNLGAVIWWFSLSCGPQNSFVTMCLSG